ncbi:hypothetical protein HPB50_023504 [Hyalomma asiaticum]|uniref:Uncharacterized protein n=1 Tax=Hyalomma asiaticum TaxID=266040 RepID=A0ACB7S9L0_HYAAI|nr:hypothetical protein HPB50_023504 [Hyalomma asiaticum]
MAGCALRQYTIRRRRTADSAAQSLEEQRASTRSAITTLRHDSEHEELPTSLMGGTSYSAVTGSATLGHSLRNHPVDGPGDAVAVAGLGHAATRLGMLPLTKAVANFADHVVVVAWLIQAALFRVHVWKPPPTNTPPNLPLVPAAGVQNDRRHFIFYRIVRVHTCPGQIRHNFLYEECGPDD